MNKTSPPSIRSLHLQAIVTPIVTLSHRATPDFYSACRDVSDECITKVATDACYGFFLENHVTMRLTVGSNFATCKSTVDSTNGWS